MASFHIWHTRASPGRGVVELGKGGALQWIMLDRAKLLAILTALAITIAPSSGRTQNPAAESQYEAASSSASLLAQGEAAYQKGELEEARRLLENAIRFAPRSARAHALLGMTLARQEDLNGALLNLRQAYKIDPGNSDFAYDYALLLLQARRFAAAIPILERMHRQSPQSDDVLVNLARAYAATGNFGKLAATVHALPPHAFGDETLLKALASVLAGVKQSAAIEQLWQGAIRHNPGEPLPYAALAKFWIARGQAARALTLLDGAPVVTRGPVYFYALGETQRALGKYNQACGSFRQLVHMLPDNKKAWRQLVQSYLLANQLTEAKSAAEQANRKFPDIVEFQYQQAVVDYMLGRNAAAIEDLAPVLERESRGDPRPVLLMAVLQSANGNYDEATRYFARAAQLDHTCNALTSYFYGATLLRMHRPQDAAAQLQTAIRCQPHFALAQYRLGLALSQSGKPQEAVAALQQSIEIDSTLAEPYYALAQVQQRLGNTSAAQAALARFNSLHRHVNSSDHDLFRSGMH
ncbi:MAG: tetratricopeptide repeat protein [Terriglobia bacterium]